LLKDQHTEEILTEQNGKPKERGSSTRVIVIDDDTMLRDFLQRCLRKAGYEVITARNGVEGLCVMKDQKFDLVVSDIFMPDADGLEVLRQLRQFQNRIPLLMMSGGSKNLPDDFLKIANALGATATLAKPFTAREFLDAVEKIIRPGRGDTGDSDPP